MFTNIYFQKQSCIKYCINTHIYTVSGILSAPWKPNIIVYAPMEDSDQLVHMSSLILCFTVGSLNNLSFLHMESEKSDQTPQML